jgi:hypothetical protein
MSVYRQQGWADPSGTATTATKDFRDNPIQNNIMVAVVQAATTVANILETGGMSTWTLASGVQVAATASSKVFVKRAGAAESKTVTCDLGASVQRRMHIYEIPDTGTGTPTFAAATPATSAPSVTTLATNSATPLTTRSVAFAAFANNGLHDVVQSYTNDFRNALGGLESNGWIHTAYKPLTSTASVSTTGTWGTARNVAAHLVVIDLASTPVEKSKRKAAWREDGPTNTDGISVSPSFVATTGEMLVAHFALSHATVTSGGTAAVTDSAGDTWIKQIADAYNGTPGTTAREAQIWTCVPTVSGSRTVTFTGVTIESIWGLIEEVTGRASIAQTVDVPSGQTTGTGYSLAFASAPAASSVVTGILLHGAVERHLTDTTPAGHLLAGEGSMLGQGQQTSVQMYDGSDQSLRWDWTSNIHWVACGVELAAPSGTAHTRTITRTLAGSLST